MKKNPTPDLFEQNQDAEIINADSEELQPEVASSFDQLIDRELKKFDSVVPAVNELSKEFMPLKIQSIDDKEGYQEVSKALRFVISKRTAVEDKRKELKADSLAYGRAVDARAKEITSMLSPIEEHLKQEKLRIDNEIERLKKEEEEKKQKAINDRILKLLELNMFQMMTEFVWKSKLTEEEVTFLRVNLEMYSDEDFEEFTNTIRIKIEAENEKIQQLENERKQKEEEQKAEQLRLDEEKRKVEEEKAKLLKEMEDIKNERAEIRNAQLSKIGLGSVSLNPNWIYMKKSTNGYDAVVTIISFQEVRDLSNSDWDKRLLEISSTVDKLREEDEKEFAIKEEQRKAQELKKQEEENQKKAKEEAELMQKELDAERERIASMSDKELYLEYIEKLKCVPVPQLKTKKYEGYLKTITKTFETFQNVIN